MLVSNQSRSSAGINPAVAAGAATGRGFSAQFAAALNDAPKSPAPLPAISPNDSSDSESVSIAALMMPSEASVGRLMRQVQGALQQKMAAAGMSTSPAFEINEDPTTGAMSISGNRPDKAAIESMINGDPKLRLRLHNVSALASQIPVMQTAAHYASAWANAGDDAQRNTVYSYYRSLFDSLHSVTQLSMGPQGLALSLNGTNIPVANDQG